METNRQYASAWESYELLDAGGGKKLERFGEIITIRPELQAYFKSQLSFEEWNQMAHWEFVEKTNTKGNWKKIREDAPQQWQISFETITLRLELTKFKHLGVFPEQMLNWHRIQSILQPGKKYLNLFAYTGAASLIGRSTGAEVTHVDSVKQLVTWANENQQLSDLSGIKWVVEDALKFIQREAKRGNFYDGISMDPPAFGLGAKGEKWILEEKLPELVEAAQKVLHPSGFLIVNTYSPKLSRKHLEQIAQKYVDKKSLKVDELWMKTKTGKDLFYGNVLHLNC